MPDGSIYFGKNRRRNHSWDPTGNKMIMRQTIFIVLLVGESSVQSQNEKNSGII